MSMFNTFFEFLVPLFANTTKTEYDIQALSKATGISVEALQDNNQYEIDVNLMAVQAMSAQGKKNHTTHVVALTNRKTGETHKFVGQKQEDNITYTNFKDLPVSAFF